jgi:hypothetical protein
MPSSIRKSGSQCIWNEQFLEKGSSRKHGELSDAFMPEAGQASNYFGLSATGLAERRS